MQVPQIIGEVKIADHEIFALRRFEQLALAALARGEGMANARERAERAGLQHICHLVIVALVLA